MEMSDSQITVKTQTLFTRANKIVGVQDQSTYLQLMDRQAGSSFSGIAKIIFQ